MPLTSVTRVRVPLGPPLGSLPPDRLQRSGVSLFSADPAIRGTVRPGGFTGAAPSDEQPKLLFRLRRVGGEELIASAGTGLPLSRKGRANEMGSALDRPAEPFGPRSGTGEDGSEPGPASPARRPGRKRRPAGVYCPNTFLSRSVVLAAGLVRMFASSCPILTKRPSTAFWVT